MHTVKLVACLHHTPLLPTRVCVINLVIWSINEYILRFSTRLRLRVRSFKNFADSLHSFQSSGEYTINMAKESQNMLDSYIHDYLVKRKYYSASKTFQAEAEVPGAVVSCNEPGFGDNMDRLLDPNHGTILKSLAGQSRRTPQTTCGCISSYLHPTKQVLPLKGWPLMAKLWCTDLMEQKCILEEHSHAITDTGFSPITPRLATSSLDKTIRVWDVENVDQHVFSFARVSLIV